jgi:hypothetical protein
MVDVHNESITAFMCVELSEMVKLLQVVRGIDESMERAKDTAGKQDLFK